MPRDNVSVHIPTWALRELNQMAEEQGLKTMQLVRAKLTSLAIDHAHDRHETVQSVVKQQQHEFNTFVEELDI